MIWQKKKVKEKKNEVIESKIQEKINIEKLKKLVGDKFENQIIEDKYILDDENAIILIENPDKGDINKYYIMIHLRMDGNNLTEVNRWYMKGYYFGSIHNVKPIKELNLFQVQNGAGSFNALYDYKKGVFVVSKKVWGIVDSGRDNKFLEKYNGFLATFEINSDYEEDDVYAYDNPITTERIVESFCVRDGYYYAILNIDGTIRGNKLFKGKSFSRITEMIDLSKYESITSFKKERKNICNETKKRKKQEYYQLLESRNDGSISPYLDNEVARILELNQKN